MKSLFILLTSCTLFISSVKAQGLGKIHYGLKGGYNYVIAAYTAAKTQGTHGGYLGVMMKVPFDNRLFFNPQIDFNYRGMKTTSLPPNEFSEVKELQLRVMPLVQIDFKHPDKNENTFFLSTGPSLGFGITGHQAKQDQNGNVTERSLHYGFQRYGQFDANWHLGLGYETTNGLRLLVDYTHGLGNMINTNFAGNLRYRTISAGVGYWFGKKK
nr:porin family protein [uncultured Lacibacter sp.]